MRKNPLITNAYYHIYNRSNNDKPIFLEEKDYVRFLFFVLFCQSPLSFSNISRHIAYFVEHRVFNIPPKTVKEIETTRGIELNTFTLMPNHFHLSLKQGSDGGISRYLHRIQNGYAKYFNTKYKERGHLFQGAFRAVPVETDEQLLYLSAYIHRNPRELKEWRGKEIKYPWSSYQDIAEKNRWGGLLQPHIITDQFSSPNSYREFVETSTAKLRPEESPIQNILLE